MKTIIKQYNLYNFNELSEKAKQKARETFNDATSEYPFLKGLLQEELSTLLKENNMTETGETKLYYSLSNCQGDGVCFIGSFIWKDYTITITHSGNYYHENSKTFSMNRNNNLNEIDDSEYESFDAVYVSICKKLEEMGYEEIEYQTSEESFANTCEANEYTFLDDGTIMNA